MDYRPLGRTGIKVSQLCLGAMMFGGRTEFEDGVAIIDKAIDQGINFIDTANVYSRGISEEVVGEAIKRRGRRDTMVIATKVHGVMDSEDPNGQGNSRRHIIQQCEASLRRLQTDWIDLYQIHRPQSDIPIDETLRALDDLVRSGKVRYLGALRVRLSEEDLKAIDAVAIPGDNVSPYYEADWAPRQYSL